MCDSYTNGTADVNDTVVGCTWNAGELGNYLGHAVVGCGSSVASGGNSSSCGRSAAAGIFGAWVSANTTDANGWNAYTRGMATTAAGGVTSRMMGGSFADGATTAAYGYLFNALPHPDEGSSCQTDGCRKASQQDSLPSDADTRAIFKASNLPGSDNIAMSKAYQELAADMYFKALATDKPMSALLSIFKFEQGGANEKLGDFNFKKTGALIIDSIKEMLTPAPSNLYMLSTGQTIPERYTGFGGGVLNSIGYKHKDAYGQIGKY